MHDPYGFINTERRERSFAADMRRECGDKACRLDGKNQESDMRSRSITVNYQCPCGKVTTVTAYPIIPATWESPEEGGDIDPDTCDGCWCRIGHDEVCQMASDKLEDLKAEKYERD